MRRSSAAVLFRSSLRFSFRSLDQQIPTEVECDVAVGGYQTRVLDAGDRVYGVPGCCSSAPVSENSSRLRTSCGGKPRRFTELEDR